MFRKMTRETQGMSEAQIEKILEKATSGVLSLIGDGGYAYGVPMSFCFHEGKIYFHGAKQGHKIDAILANNKVSFTVIATDNIIPEELTTYFRSVIVFGKIRISEDLDEKRQALQCIVDKYSHKYVKKGETEIERALPHVAVSILEIEHMTGKMSKEYVG
ncbi:MAG: pyridoxamine 5'-phosphate oxidase family protein [Turicibacter sp.]|nr:pyridoxamine 5'-phosphate oxidase family protein [Turicibacter sp.]